MKCSVCHAENPDHADVCNKCGTPCGAICTRCEATVLAGSKFCAKCGHPLSPSQLSHAIPNQFSSPINYTPADVATKILNSRNTVEGERKQATALFCDIVNSTPLTERLGPDSMHSLLNCFFELVLAQIHAYEGTVNKFLGDGFLAMFGVPLAHEDHARRAVYAALDIRKALVERQAESFPVNGRTVGGPGSDSSVQNALRTLQVRIGINTGLVVVGNIGDDLETEYTAVGDTMNVAARLQTVAEPGTIVVSESTYRATVDDFEYLPLGSHAIKGKSEKIIVHKVIDRRKKSTSAVKGVGRSISSPLLGRVNEINILLGVVDQFRTGRGGIVSIIGEAGIGKSRLISEIKGLIASKNIQWLEGRSRPIGRLLSYRPFQEIIRSVAGILEDDDADVSWEKLDKRISALFAGAREEVLPYLATLLTLDIEEELATKVKYLDAQAMGHQIFRSSRLFFEHIARENPLFIVFEDTHWMDQSSARLLEHLVPLIESVPILVCLVTRPEDKADTASSVKTAVEKYAAQYTEIVLQPLSPFDCGVLLRNLLKTDDLSLTLVKLIVQKAEGNPFFVEEVVRALIDMGGIIHDEQTGGWRVTPQANVITIPDTLQALIMSRIDRLSEDLKQVLRTASVIGRNFFYRLLNAVDSQKYSRPETLEKLQNLELIRERSRIPDLEYSFKHALVQESAYESVVLQRRRELHKLVGQYIEELYADRLEEFYGLIAYHYARAAVWDKAQDYLLKVGDQAGKMAADGEALEHYHQAIAAFEQSGEKKWDPFQRAVIERKIGEALFRRGNLDLALETLYRALTYLGGQPYPRSRRAVRIAIVRESFRQLAHRLSRGWHRDWQSRPISPRDEELSFIYDAMSWIHYFVDQESLALDVLLMLNLAEDTGLRRAEVQGLSELGLLFDIIPIFSLAERYHRRALVQAQKFKDPVSIGHAYLFLAHHEHYRGMWTVALSHFGEAAASYRKAGHLRGWGVCYGMSTLLLGLRGNLAKGLEQANEMVRVGEDAADSQLLAWGLGHLACFTFYCAGTLEEARAHAERGVEIARSLPDYVTVAATNAHLAYFHLQCGKLQLAGPFLRESMRLFSEKQLKSPFTEWSQLHIAEVLLAEAEFAGGTAWKTNLSEANKLFEGILNRSRTTTAFKANAFRLKGIYEWLNGNHIKARKCWQQSLKAAVQLGATYDLARTHLEIGRRTGEFEHLKNAEAIFAEIGANLDLQQTRALMEVQVGKTIEN